MNFVLDCSMTMAWFLEDEATPYTDRVQDILCAGSEALVPSIWPFEVVNVFFVAERRRRIQPEKTNLFLNRLSTLPIRVQAAPPPAEMKTLIETAREYNITSYDAAYLELARRERLPMATLDNDLIRCAKASGISLLAIDSIAK